MVGIAEAVLRAKGYATGGERVIVCAGVPFKQPGTTNMLRVFTLGKSEPGGRN